MHYFYVYLLKSIICSLIFVAYYYAALRNKTFHKYNRFYILSAIILSILLPFLKLEVIFNKPEQIQPFTYHYYQQYILVGNQNETVEATKNLFTFNNFILTLIISVVALSFGYILKTIYFIYKLNKNNEHIKIENVNMVLTSHCSTPFSFWKTIFWNKNISINNEEGKMILQHELAHIKDKHTLDKLFLNVITALFWFNPFFWLLKKELFLIHEFIADQKSGAQHYKAVWASALLTATYPTNHAPIFNSFFYSPLKRRLLMLSKTNNPAKNYVIRLFAFFLILLTSLAFTIKAQQKPTQAQQKAASIVSKVMEVEKPDFQNANNWIEIKSDKILVSDNNTISYIGHVSLKIKRTNETLYLNNKTTSEEALNSLASNEIQLVKLAYKENEKAILNVYTYDFVIKNNIEIPKGNAGTKIMKISIGNGEEINLKATARVQEANNKDNLQLQLKTTDSLTATTIKANQISFAEVKEEKVISANGDVKIIEIKKADKIIERPIQQFSKDAEYIEIKKVNVSGKNILKEVENENGNKNSIKNKLDFKSVLVIIDGIEQPLNNMENISPNDIKSIDVLKAKAATDIYGEKGKNGVLIITTKRPKKIEAL